MSTQTTIRRAYRETRGRWVGGVAAGLAEHLGWPVAAVRALFVVASFFAGIGVIAYAAYWAVLPQRDQDDSDTARLLAFAALVIGGFLLLPANPWMQVGLPLAVIALGATVVWTRVGPTRILRPDGLQWTALGLGILLVLVGVVALAATGLGVRSLLNVGAVALLLLVGVGLIAMPWIAGLYRELTVERQERVRSQTRAELATQVHDSVLQTLTLIRRHADDPEQVARLARAEERHLRSWLYEPQGDPQMRLSAALSAAAARIESDYPATVELVCVGELELDESGRALVAATTEAMVNAAKHAGGAVSVYVEVDDGRVTVFVRDRGPGFDAAAVPPDRKGIVESMIGRMQRAGGTCEIRSDERGTEVTLALPVTPMIRLVIVDDHEMVRAGIRGGLPADIEVVGEAADVQSAVSVISAQEPDVVLLDVHLPGGNAQAVLQQSSVNSRFLALSVSDASQDVIGVVRLGARGYVTKDITSADLATAIRQVAAGEAVFSPRLAGFVLDAFTGAAAKTDDELDRLTARERDVMRLIARGYTYREAAEELFLSVKTVETHMSAVLRKLQLSNRRELARWAKGRGLE